MIGTNTVQVLLVSAHDWFASALQAVLEPEGFVFARVRSARHALRHVEQGAPDLVIIGDKPPDIDAAGLARAVRTGGLRPSIPILVYSPNFWNEREQAAAMQAGAWDVIKEPVRPSLVVAKLRRLLEIKRLIELTEESSLTDSSTGLLNLAGLLRSMRQMEASAHRNEAPLSCVVIGPSTPAAGSDLERQRVLAAQLCSRQLRESDVCGWIDAADFGVIAYNTTAAGLTTLVRRLNHTLSGDALEGWRLRPLSAGVVEFPPHADDAADSPGRRSSARAPRIASLSRIVAAQTALREAREHGGGIRISEIS
jgi:DNA-binding response OmpR family regulator